MESFDAIDATGTVPLFHVEPAADPLHLTATLRVLGESPAAGSRSPGDIQAERSAMHPERDDVEWHYCRSGRVG